jgi:hypothetical protein
MDKNTFGSSEEIIVLNLIHNKLDSLNDNEKRSLSKFLVNFNEILKTLQDVNNLKCRKHLIGLVKSDYLIRLDNLLASNRFDEILISYLKNFVVTKIKIAIKQITA